MAVADAGVRVNGELLPHSKPIQADKSGRPLPRFQASTYTLGQELTAEVFGAAEVIGARAVLTHAKDDDVRRFYERFDFVASPKNALHLFILLETIRESLGQ